MSKKRKWIIDAGLLIVVLIMSLFVCFRLKRMINFFQNNSEIITPQDAVNSDAIVQPTPTNDADPISVSPAIDFELLNLDGKKVALSDFYGKPIMVNFWEVRCPPCRAELPLIQAYAELYEDEFVVLAINTGEQEETIKNFFQEYKGIIVFLIDKDKTTAEAYEVRGLPTSVFINSEGSIAATHIGELNEMLLVAYLREIGVIE